MTPNYLIDMLEKPFEMESLLTLIRHLLAFELTRFFLFPPPVYKIAMGKARWGAVYPETHRLVLKIEGQVLAVALNLEHREESIWASCSTAGAAA